MRSRHMIHVILIIQVPYRVDFQWTPRKPERTRHGQCGPLSFHLRLLVKTQ